MRIIKPSVEEFKPVNPIQHIERCGRVCYKSEDKITDTSAEKFVTGIVKRGHLSVTEHFRYILEVDRWCYHIIESTHPKYLELTDDGRFLISGSARGFIDLYDSLPDESDQKFAVWECINTILCNSYGADCLFPGFLADPIYDEYTLIEPRDLSPTEAMTHDWHTLKFICDRGVTHELVRHRPCSFSQESTRYCNYSGDKFGNELTFILPCFWKPGSDQMFHWSCSMKLAENHYFDLIQAGATPQEARSVLPNSLKTELVITATNEEWLHLLKLRCSKAAHPQAQEVCNMAKDILAKADPEIFGGL